MDRSARGIEERLARLRTEVQGTVVGPNDDGYDEARAVWNGMIDRRPVAVLRAAGIADIARTVAAAVDLEIPLAIRGGGHNVAGNGTVDDGIVLDLSGLTAVEVDPVARTVRVEPGSTLADVDRATEPHGLAVPIGVVSGTGVAGLTLGGGVGWLTRPYGLAADNLVSADLVTASGERVTAGEGEGADPELLWGLRGGGGNFGVVTSFTFRAHPHGPGILAVTFIYRLDQMPAAVRAWSAWTSDLPDEGTSITTTMVPPADWDLGEEPLHLIGLAWAGADRVAFDAAATALRIAAPPHVEVPHDAGWAAWQSAADGLFPKGSRAYWKNTSFGRFDEVVIEILVRRAAELTWRGTAFDIHHMEGAFGRVAEDATPFPNRAARYWLNVYGYWNDPEDDAARTAFVRGVAADMEPHTSGGQYLNFMGREPGDTDVRRTALSVYGEAKLERLAALKRRYDPDNVFRLNLNVPPG